MSLKDFYKGKMIGFVVVLVIVFGYFYFTKLPKPDTSPTILPEEKTKQEPITINPQNIKEDNFTGQSIVINGNNTLADTARAYVAKTISDFRIRANAEVPDLKEKFGEEAPVWRYSINIDGSYVSSVKTESIIISLYVYTGGANGMSSYKVFTASKDNGKIISINQLVKTDSVSSFVKLVKDKLFAFRPQGMTEMVVFPDDVDKLTLADMPNWSMDDKNLIIYFDKYAVGPGALGPVPLSIPLADVGMFLNF